MGVFAFCTKGRGYLGAKWGVCVCVCLSMWEQQDLSYSSEKLSHVRLTFAASLYLTHTVQCVWHQVWEPPIQIHWCQTALKALLCVHQFGQILVHLLGHPSNIKVTCGDSTNAATVTPSGRKGALLGVPDEKGGLMLYCCKSSHKDSYTLITWWKQLNVTPITPMLHSDFFFHPFLAIELFAGGYL